MDAAKRKKSSANGWLTRAMREVDEVARNLDTSNEVVYDTALRTFNERLEKWDEAQAVYESLVHDDDLNDVINEAADFREGAVKCRDNLIVRWNEAHPAIPEEGNDARSTKSTGSCKPHVNLPRIDLPKFSGDVLKFTSFWQQFSACVDECEYPVVSKFNYLVSCLKGEAMTVIEEMPITAEN